MAVNEPCHSQIIIPFTVSHLPFTLTRNSTMNHLWRSDYNFLVNWMIRDNDSQYDAANESHSAPPFLCVASLQSNTISGPRYISPFINSRHYGETNEEFSKVRLPIANYTNDQRIKSYKRNFCTSRVRDRIC